MRTNSRTFKQAFVLALSVSMLASYAGATETEVELPESSVQTMTDIPKPQENPSWLEMGLSSWAPGNFTLPGADGNFGRAGIPSLFVNYSMPAFLPGLKAKIGGNYLALSRSNDVSSDAAVISNTETVNLFSARIGAEYTPTTLAGKTLEPYAGLALLPTFGMTSQSAVDDGNLYFGVPVELSLGSRLSLKKIGIPWNGADLDLGITGTAGTVDHSSVSGLGVSGGLRVLL